MAERDALVLGAMERVAQSVRRVARAAWRGAVAYLRCA